MKWEARQNKATDKLSFDFHFPQTESFSDDSADYFPAAGYRCFSDRIQQLEFECTFKRAATINYPVHTNGKNMRKCRYQ